MVICVVRVTYAGDRGGDVAVTAAAVTARRGDAPRPRYVFVWAPGLVTV